jgi:hypothetical protein
VERRTNKCFCTETDSHDGLKSLPRQWGYRSTTGSTGFPATNAPVCGEMGGRVLRNSWGFVKTYRQSLTRGNRGGPTSPSYPLDAKASIAYLTHLESQQRIDATRCRSLGEDEYGRIRLLGRTVHPPDNVCRHRRPLLPTSAVDEYAPQTPCQVPYEGRLRHRSLCDECWGAIGERPQNILHQGTHAEQDFGNKVQGETLMMHDDDHNDYNDMNDNDDDGNDNTRQRRKEEEKEEGRRRRRRGRRKGSL